MTHRCDAAACTAEIARGKFMCTRHWHMVPKPLQNTINDRYRICRKDMAFLSDVAYLDACVRAIEHVATGEGIQAVHSSYHRLLQAAKLKE
jgi:hypothetical protein